MSLAIPNFADYHRTVIGFHGTKQSVAENLVLGREQWKPSENSSDWLGRGVYFWEHAPQQAWAWARRLKQTREWKEEVAVVGAMIRLSNCLDLLEPEMAAVLKGYHSTLVSEARKRGLELPRNVRHRRDLDCKVFEFAYDRLAANGRSVDTARGVYVPTEAKKRLWPGSWLAEDAHIQLVVRPESISSCILGVWLERNR